MNFIVIRLISIFLLIISFHGCNENIEYNGIVFKNSDDLNTVKDKYFNQDLQNIKDRICSNIKLSDKQKKVLNNFDKRMFQEIHNLYPNFNSSRAFTNSIGDVAISGTGNPYADLVTVGIGLLSNAFDNYNEDKYLSKHDSKIIVKKFKIKKQQYYQDLVNDFYKLGCNVKVVEIYIGEWENFLIKDGEYRKIKIKIKVNNQQNININEEETNGIEFNPKIKLN